MTSSIEHNWRYRRDEKGLVKMYATCLIVGIYSKLRDVSWIKCLIKCIWSSVCLVYWCSIGLFEMCIALWLSHQRKVELSEGNPNFVINCQIHKTSWLASIDALYYSSIEYNVWACFFLQDHVIGLEPRQKEKPEVDLWSSISLAQSEPV